MKQTKDERIEFRVTAEDKAKLYKIASDRGLTFPDMIFNDYKLGKKIKPSVAKPHEKATLDLVEELRKLNSFLSDPDVKGSVKVEAIHAIQLMLLQKLEELNK